MVITIYKYKQYVVIFTKGPASNKRTTLGDFSSANVNNKWFKAINLWALGGLWPL